MHKIWVLWLLFIYRNPSWKNIFWKCIKGALPTSVYSQVSKNNDEDHLISPSVVLETLIYNFANLAKSYENSNFPAQNGRPGFCFGFLRGTKLSSSLQNTKWQGKKIQIFTTFWWMLITQRQLYQTNITSVVRNNFLDHYLSTQNTFGTKKQFTLGYNKQHRLFLSQFTTRLPYYIIAFPFFSIYIIFLEPYFWLHNVTCLPSLIKTRLSV